MKVSFGVGLSSGDILPRRDNLQKYMDLVKMIDDSGVEALGNNRTAVYSNMVPVAALITAWLWLGEVPTPIQRLAIQPPGAIILDACPRLSGMRGD